MLISGWLNVVCSEVEGDVEQCDGVRLEDTATVVVSGEARLPRGQDGGQDAVQGPSLRDRIRAGARHHQVVRQNVDADAKALLDVGDFRLNAEHAL